MKGSKFSGGMVLSGVALWSLILLVPFAVQAQVPKIKEEAPPAAAPAPEAPEEGERVVLHLVHEGEELHMLAAYYYGDARQWPKIYQANRDQIRNPNRIDKKMILSIPVSGDWQPYMSYEKFFQKATAGAPPAEAPEAAPAEEKKSEEKKPEGIKPEEKKAPGKQS